MSHVLAERDDRIYQDREIRLGDGIHVHRGDRACKMPASGESDDANLAHAPFFSVEPAITESILYVLKRNFPMTVRQAVFHYGASYSPIVHPLGEIDSFIPRRQVVITTARTRYDHESVRVLWQIYVNPSAIGHVCQKTPFLSLFGSRYAIRLKRAFRYVYFVFFDSLINILPLRIKINRLRWSVIDGYLRICLQFFFNRRRLSVWMNINLRSIQHVVTRL